MSPEQASGDSSQIGPATDIFALGILLYELVTGRLPFSGNNLLELLKQLETCKPAAMPGLAKHDQSLEAICRNCLRANPQDRYSSALQLSEDLERYLNSDPLLGSATDEHRLPIRNAWRRGLIVVSGMMFALFMVYLVVVRRDAVSTEKFGTHLDHTSVTRPSAQFTYGAVTSTEDREMAIEVIRRGGSVDVSFGGTSIETGDVASLPDEPFELTWVMMPRSRQVTDVFLQQLVSLNGLAGLDLYDTSITDSSCTIIGQMSELHQVYVHNTPITDLGAKSILCIPYWQEINFNWTQITDRTLEELAGSSSLELLRIRDTLITDAGLRRIAEMPFLTTLDIGDNDVSDDGFLSLATSMKRVVDLSIDGTRVSDQSLLAMKEWPLRQLQCSRSTISEAGLQQFRKDHPDCHVKIE